MNDVEDLLWRRQFLISSKPWESPANWQHSSVGPFQVYCHPELKLTRAISADLENEAVLVGFALDPDFPARSNHQILEQFIAAGGSLESVAESLNGLTGRFVLLLKTPSDSFVFHDPCGLRSLFYTTRRGDLYLASSPPVLVDAANLSDATRLQSYMKSDYMAHHIEHWIPSGTSLYEEVGHLVPNHYLRLSDIKQIRYWPTSAPGEMPYAELVKESSQLLEKIIRAGAARSTLSLSLTAGWDSRLLLAAARTVSDQLSVYTLRYRKLNMRSADIRIPKQLCEALGLKHRIIDCREGPSDRFSEMYLRNNAAAHLNDWGLIAYGMRKEFPNNMMAVKGNCSEVARCFGYKDGVHPKDVDTQYLVSLIPGWDEMPFIANQVDRWRLKTEKIAGDFAINMLDLFYWEHRMGGWQAQSQLEWDIVQEVFVPFNHRGLLMMMLSAPSDQRCAPRFDLYSDMCQFLHPEVLEFPVNPPTALDTIRDGTKRVLKRFGLSEYAKKAPQHS
jgi:hypothetical protein